MTTDEIAKCAEFLQRDEEELMKLDDDQIFGALWRRATELDLTPEVWVSGNDHVVRLHKLDVVYLGRYRDLLPAMLDAIEKYQLAQ